MKRLKKIEADLKREIGFIINSKIKDPRIGFVTITDTKLSPDFSYLDVFLSVMEKENAFKDSLKRLNTKQCKGFIKKQIKERMQLRSLPEIRFVEDISIDKGMKIHKLLESIKGDKEETGEK
jgi:ribosome-binding factor A